MSLFLARKQAKHWAEYRVWVKEQRDHRHSRTVWPVGYNNSTVYVWMPAVYVIGNFTADFHKPIQYMFCWLCIIRYCYWQNSLTINLCLWVFIIGHHWIKANKQNDFLLVKLIIEDYNCKHEIMQIILRLTIV